MSTTSLGRLGADMTGSSEEPDKPSTTHPLSTTRQPHGSLSSITPSGSNPSGVRNAFQCPSRKTMTKDIAPNTKRAKIIIERERI